MRRANAPGTTAEPEVRCGFATAPSHFSCTFAEVLTVTQEEPFVAFGLTPNGW